MRRAIHRSLEFGMVLAMTAASATGAFAQGGLQIKITQIDNSRFPQVTVYVSVTNAGGEPVWVDPATIQISEDGQPMDITSLEGGGQGGVGPLATMLVMDVSGSMNKNRKIDGAKAAAEAYVDQMRAGDWAGLMIYNTKTKHVQPLTQDRNTLKAAINGIQTGGDTAMYDALFAAEAVLNDVQGRKAIIAVTDGLDNSSSHDEDDIINAIGLGGLSISTIGLGDATSTAQNGLDEPGLRSLAQRAGGGYSFAGDAQALSALFQALARELQNEYALTYVSPFTLRDGVNRALAVSLSDAPAINESKYNPGGVLPEVGSHSWTLFGGLLIGLVGLIFLPALLAAGSRLLGGRRKRSRIKLIGRPSADPIPGTRGRIKIK